MNDKISEIITLLKIADRYMTELERDELIGDDPRSYLMEVIDEMERIREQDISQLNEILDSYEWLRDCNDGSCYKEIKADDIQRIKLLAEGR